MTEKVRIPTNNPGTSEPARKISEVTTWIDPNSLTPSEQQQLIARLKEQFRTDDGARTHVTRLAIQRMLDTHGINSSLVLIPPDATIQAAVGVYNLLSYEHIPHDTVEDFSALNPEERLVSKNRWYEGRMGPKSMSIYQEMIGNARTIMESRRTQQQ